jgi:hypothetical protein
VAEAGDGAGLPQFVEREFREFLTEPVQAAKAKARGSRSSHNLKAMIYLIAGKLEMLPFT